MMKMELKETVDLMLSDDYKERFKAEYYQVTIRIDKLDTMILKYKNNELEFKPSCSVEVLERQLEAMLKYAKSLEVRAEIEGIDISKIHLMEE